VLDNADGPSSLIVSLSTVVVLLEGWINTAATNGVRWGTRSALVATVSHFSELVVRGLGLTSIVHSILSCP
jgi:membrane protease subunit (stomatin/prohibitin family)